MSVQTPKHHHRARLAVWVCTPRHVEGQDDKPVFNKNHTQFCRVGTKHILGNRICHRGRTCMKSSTTMPNTNQQTRDGQSPFVTKNERYRRLGFGDMENHNCRADP